MHVDEAKCIGCSNCVPVCPMGAIYIGDNRLAEIDQEVCVECQACYRGMSTENLPKQPTRFLRNLLAFFKLRFQPDPDICPTGAITRDELTWPRTLRRVFSDPLMPHESTGIGGRGTMEVKTNDVTERIKEGEAGFTVEFGRPGIGAYFRDVDRVCRALAGTSVEFQPENPVTVLMSDVKTGEIREDVLNEKVLSCILEFKMDIAKIPEILKVIEDEVKQLDTVVALGIAIRCDSKGNDTVRSQLEALGYDAWRAKINMGLGRHTNPVLASEEMIS
ncbi:MAG TPA: 4Fe-4S binding protein [Dehalococcoidia bacterium]|nr:4Fe-4S binding protein [Dehalococcoidia bacterium]